MPGRKGVKRRRRPVPRMGWVLVCFWLAALSAKGNAVAESASFTVPYGRAGESARFDFWAPAHAPRNTGVLLLVPGHNGSGAGMLTPEWKRFAEANGLVLLAPTFHVSLEELRAGKGYYYPAQGSGEAVERALTTLARKVSVRTDRILVFGFSAGAHFAHRFAIWKPGRVRAFVAYSAAWWSEPSEAMTRVPALIMCGEDDPRFTPTLEFMEEALTLGLPWIWRSYRGTGHEMTPTVQRMAEEFLAYYAGDGSGAGEQEEFYGDIQTFEYVPVSEGDKIPDAVRVVLPSREIAETWAKEK